MGDERLQPPHQDYDILVSDILRMAQESSDVGSTYSRQKAKETFEAAFGVDPQEAADLDLFAEKFFDGLKQAGEKDYYFFCTAVNIFCDLLDGFATFDRRTGENIAFLRKVFARFLKNLPKELRTEPVVSHTVHYVVGIQTYMNFQEDPESSGYRQQLWIKIYQIAR